MFNSISLTSQRSTTYANTRRTLSPTNNVLTSLVSERQNVELSHGGAADGNGDDQVSQSINKSKHLRIQS